MATFEIIVHEQQKLVKATLHHDTIRVEAGALHYWRGNIEMTSQAPSAAGFFRSALSGETVFRPTYTGTGEVYVGPPYFGEFIVLDCTPNHPGWILDRGAFLCCDDEVEVTVHQNTAMNALLGGEGLFQTLVRGDGKVVLRAPGTVQTITLKGETIAVDGRFAVAREASLKYEVKRASASLIGSMTSGEGLLQYISGHGKVLLTPVPDLQQAMIDIISANQNPLQQAPSTPSRSPLAVLVFVAVFGLLVFGMVILMTAVALFAG